MQRIVIIGSGGSGKSTLARRLGERLNLPVYHLDALFWKPGWTPLPKDEFEVIQRGVASGDGWIIDGNYSGSMEIRLRRADTVIWIDLPRLVCLWRVIKRRLMYRGRTRPDMGEGCPEQVDLEFLAWVWNFPKKRRPEITAKLATLSPETTVVHLTSTRAVARFMEEVRKGVYSTNPSRSSASATP